MLHRNKSESDKEIEDQERRGEQRIWGVEFWLLLVVVVGSLSVLVWAYRQQIEEWFKKG